LINSFTDQFEFFEEHKPTIFDVYNQEMTMVDPTDGLSRNVQLRIIDIGSEYVRSNHVKDMDGLIVCYDVTSMESFYGLSSLFQLKMQVEHEAKETTLSTDPIQRPVVLVGCKNEEVKAREVEY